MVRARNLLARGAVPAADRSGSGPAPSAAGPEQGAQSGSGARRWLTPWCASLEEVS